LGREGIEVRKVRPSFSSQSAAWASIVIASTAAFLVAASPARACVLCLPYPKETTADLVIKSDTVVFARENPSRPFSYMPVETLKGRYDGGTIPLLVASTTARQLQSDPALTVVLAQDRAGGTWTSLGPAGIEYHAVLREVVRWAVPAKSYSARAEFFAPYLRHQDRSLAELAFLEIARAPYSTIRGIRTTVKRNDIYRVLNDFFHVEWHPLYILMLGTSERPDDIAFVRGKLKTLAEYGLTTNLGPYATAFVEMVGADAVKYLAEEFFSGRRPHSRDELLEIAKALSAQGSGGRPELRTAIVDAYGYLLTNRPELAGHVANDLFDWKVRRFAPRMREILNADVDLDEASEFAVTVYLAGTDGQSATRLGPAGGLQ
jgi:hypothetical protein